MTAEKSVDAFRTISEVAESLAVPQHVLRFWETRFSQVKPMKRAGGRRYYRPADVELLRGIHDLLYKKGYTIRGVQLILKDEGQAYVSAIGRGEVMPRKSEVAAGVAPAPGKAKVAPRLGKAPPVGAVGDAPKIIHKMSPTQSEALRAALKDLGDARKLLDAAG
jgi:DNA-binding transcriptional MerR regulator